MRYSYFKVSAVSIVSAIVVLISLSFSSKPGYEKYPALISKYTFEFNEAVIAFDKAAEAYKADEISIDSLKAALIATRLSYKKIEFFLAFNYPEYVTEHINGAPLLHIERSGTQPVVLLPEGLQVLDELVFSETVQEEKGLIAALAGKLSNNYGMIFNDLKAKAAAGKGDMAALRLQLVRIFTLGITGFDTPGSVNALQEAEASLEGMKYFFQDNYKSAPGANSINALFDGAISYLHKNTAFEDFDRLEFFMRYLDPLYKQLGAIEGSNNPEFLELTAAWNPGSNSMFANNFLNPYFFTDIKKEEDSNELRQLGEMLFYDPVLSGDGKISCATCHQPEKAFADGMPKSVSNVQGKTVLRNAPTLVNAVYADRYFYDLRAFTLEQQAEHVIFNPEEFNTAYSAILKKLQNNGRYAKKFKQVFGKGDITREKFTKALASYVLSLSSYNSAFDKYVRGEANNLPADVKNGFNLFMGKANCATCHFAPNFSGLVPPFYSENESEILGVLADPKATVPMLDSDEGRWANTIRSEYAWIYEKSFKTTTVRNAGLTTPYFHNGAYESLEEVIDFYNKGGGEGMGLTVHNQTLPPDALDLTEKEKKELIAFMQSLNDIPAN